MEWGRAGEIISLPFHLNEQCQTFVGCGVFVWVTSSGELSPPMEWVREGERVGEWMNDYYASGQK
jgi:hypothetical protein